MRGPCRSTSTQAGAPAASAPRRAAAIHPARSSGVPCEAFTRITFAPASISAATRSGVPVAGPSVATIFVRRNKCEAPIPGSSLLSNRVPRAALGHHPDLLLPEPPLELPEHVHREFKRRLGE